VNIGKSRIANILSIATICGTSQLMWQSPSQAAPTQRTCNRAINEIKTEVNRQRVNLTTETHSISPSWGINAPRGKYMMLILSVPNNVSHNRINPFLHERPLLRFATKIISNCPQTQAVIIGPSESDNLTTVGKINGRIEIFQDLPIGSANCNRWGYLCSPQ
jgi:hypothetical protein